MVSGQKNRFAIVIDQSSETVKAGLERVYNWNTTNANQDLHNLINSIRVICTGHDNRNQDMYNMVQVCKNMFLSRQEDHVSIENHSKDSKSYCETYETCETYNAG